MRLGMILLSAAIAGSIVPFAKAASGEAPFAFSADPAIGAQQRAAYAVVHQYEQYLNAGNTPGILELFAPQTDQSYPTGLAPIRARDRGVSSAR